MNRIRRVVLLVATLCCTLCTGSFAFAVENNAEDRTYRIAFMLDGAFTGNMQLRALLLKQLNDPDFQGEMQWKGRVISEKADTFMYNAESDVNTEAIDAAARAFMERTDIDLIISVDLLSFQALLRSNTLKTPILFASAADPVQEGLLTSYADTGVDNVSAYISSTSSDTEFKIFKELLNFKRLGLIYIDSDIGKKVQQLDEAQAAAQREHFELVTIAMPPTATENDCKKAVQSLIALQPDAFYAGDLGCFDPQLKPMWDNIAPFIKQGIPVLGTSSISQARAGALLTLTMDFDKVITLLSERIVTIWLGAMPRSFPFKIDRNPILSLNLATAGKLAFVPSYDLLASCDMLFHFIEKNRCASHMPDSDE